MKKIIMYLSAFVFINYSNAQVGIGTATPDNSAQLDITSANKGALIPRVSLTGTNDNVTIPNPALSLLIYNTANVNGGANPISPGFYYWDGAGWVSFSGWGLSGNSGIASNNFIGTLNTFPLLFKVNNIPSGIIDPLVNGVTSFGYGAGQFNNASGSNNTSFGYQALEGNSGGGSVGINNTAIGSVSLNSNQNGSNNTSIGYASMNNNVSGNNNTAIGNKSMQANSLGNSNIAIGTGSLANADADSNLAIGYYAMGLATTPGLSNTAVGHNSLYSNAGQYNTALGYNAAYNTGTGNNNTSIGYNSNYYNEFGSNNTSLGFNAGSGTINNLSNTTAIGAGAVVTSSNQMSFGDLNVKSWSFGRSTISSGVFQVGTDGTNGNGAYLSAGGNWTNTSDSTKKDRVTSIDGRDLIKKLMQLNVSEWYYKGTKERHIGPMAQQFYRLFELGNDNKSISSIDPAGIALRVIQEQQKEIDELKGQNDAMKKRLDKMEQVLSKINLK